MKKALLFAAGLGTRLKPFTDHHPKALASVNGVTLLERNIRYLYAAGIREVIVNVHHFADQIISALEVIHLPGLIIRISHEVDGPYETGGGLVFAAEHFINTNESFVVMNVDILTDLDLQAIMDYHESKNPLVTLAVTKRSSSRQFLFDKEMHLVGWKNNKTGEVRWSGESVEDATGYAFSGVHIINPAIFKCMPKAGKFSITDTYIQLAANQTIIGYNHTGGIVLDVGKPEALESAALLFK
jgi:N-acetyl-alpha-D-muramate 1-phosphate uridylyltransferase